MASLAMHYAIAKEYCKENKNVDFAEFVCGSLQPDLVQDKNKSHYTIPSKTQTIEEIVKNKVNLAECVKNTTLDTDFDKGVFLHLLTDHLFFSELQKILKKINIDDLSQAVSLVYKDYSSTNSFLAKKYNFDLMCLPKIGRTVSGQKPMLMNENEITNFIERCAKLDILSVLGGGGLL